jgi:hypothetical protein
VDPVFAVTLRAGLGLLFLSAAAHKLRDRAAFRATLSEYRLLPEGSIGAAVGLLIALELAAALALLVPAGAWPGVALAAGLLAAYTAAIAVNLARGRRDLDCGCLGAALRQPIGSGVIVRNGVLLFAALLCLLPVERRPLSWLDGVTIVAAVAGATALYAAVQRLMANAAGLLGWEA